MVGEKTPCKLRPVRFSGQETKGGDEGKLEGWMGALSLLRKVGRRVRYVTSLGQKMRKLRGKRTETTTSKLCSSLHDWAWDMEGGRDL